MWHRSPLLVSSLLVSSLLVAVGCLSCQRGPASALRPEQGRVGAQFSGDKPCAPRSRTDLLLVDLSDSARSELEAAARRGPVVIGYDCRNLRVLHDCRIPGSYASVPVTPKERHLRIADSDELRANAALSLMSRLEGSLNRGQELDVTWVQVGLLESALSGVTRKDMSGTCEHATHVIGRISVGAFVVKTVTRASVLAGGDLQMASAQFDSNSRRDENYSDGDIAHCRSASATTPSEPHPCQALVQAELLAIDEAPTPSVVATSSGQLGGPVIAVRLPSTPNCPDGYVAESGGCLRSTSGQTGSCAAEDRKDCTLQCDRGNADSCENLAQLLLVRGNSEANQVQSMGLRRRGCDLGSQRACLGLGKMYEDGRAVSQDFDVAGQLYATACSGGLFAACTQLGLLDHRRTGRAPVTEQGRSRLEVSFVRGCMGGDPLGCFYWGALYGYLAQEPNWDKATAGYARACRAGFGVGCTNWAALLLSDPRNLVNGAPTPAGVKIAQDSLTQGCKLGERTACLYGACLALEGVERGSDWHKAWVFLDEGCESGHVDCCRDAGALLVSRGNAEERKQARKYLAFACTEQDASACMQLAEAPDEEQQKASALTQRLELFDKSCQLDQYGSSCLRLGELYETVAFGRADPLKAVTYFAESCERNNDEGCRRLAHAYCRGFGVPKDTRRATELLSRRCNPQLKEGPSCNDLGQLLLEQGGPASSAEAVSMLQFACDRNQADACQSLGEYELSLIDLSGRRKAELLFAKGCLLGNPRGCDRIRELLGQSAPTAEPRINLGSAITGCLDREIQVLFE